MYMLQLQVNKGFGAKHLQSYNTSITPNWVNPEHIVNWIICCLEDYRLTKLKGEEILDILMLNMIRDIRIVRRDGKVIISTSADLYVDLYSLVKCLLDSVNDDYTSMTATYKLVESYLKEVNNE